MASKRRRQRWRRAAAVAYRLVALALVSLALSDHFAGPRTLRLPSSWRVGAQGITGSHWSRNNDRGSAMTLCQAGRCARQAQQGRQVGAQGHGSKTRRGGRRAPQTKTRASPASTVLAMPFPSISTALCWLYSASRIGTTQPAHTRRGARPHLQSEPVTCRRRVTDGGTAQA